jgi:dTDP-4-dehydrorhamnose reductase
MKKSILITGGSGLLALNWALKMRDVYDVVICIHERYVSLSGIKTIQLDLNAVEDIKIALEHYKPFIVIHTAGLTNIEICQKNPLLANHVNVELAKNVAIATAQLDIKMVHISTDHLFSGIKPFMGENDIIQPLNVYASTKAEAEKIVLLNPQVLIIRTNFFCWGPSYRNSFSDFIINSSNSGKHVTLFDNVFYSPILVETLVDVVHDLLNINTQGVYNVVSNVRISKYEFGIILAKKFGLNQSLIKKGFFEENPDLVIRPLDMSLSNDKLVGTLGRNIISIEQQIELLFAQNFNKLNIEIINL